VPCFLKQRTADSPGIISFTVNEAFWGVCAKSRSVKRFLSASRADGSWLAGVHVQGDLGAMQWPLEDWHAFVLWPDRSTPFVRTLPSDVFIPLNCVNFLPDEMPLERGPRPWDLCVITRAAAIKRPVQTLHVVRALLDLDSTVTANIIAPDHRRFGSGKSMRKQDLAAEFYKATDLFAARELPNISFLVSSVDAFGRFPLGARLLEEIVARSQFVFLYSHSEGTPRALGEALVLGTPCIVSKNLRTGIREWLTPQNTLFVDDDPAAAAAQIHDALENYDRFEVDVAAARRAFGASTNVPLLKERLTAVLEAAGKPVDGEWYLRDLHLRLACHGQKHNSQFMGRDGKLFFHWLEAVQRLDPYDEDAVLGSLISTRHQARPG
jgi:hypothetical protein